MKKPIVCACLATALLVAPAQAPAASSKGCSPVRDPYAGTRYEGTDLSQIKTVRVSCATARRTARGAHRRALALPIAASGVRRFSWNGWAVTGDLRGDSDRYVAKKGSRQVRWRF